MAQSNPVSRSWPVAAVALLVVAGCVALGLWQLERAGLKEQRAARMQARAEQAPLSMDALLARDDPAHYPVHVQGHFDNSRNILLDNRMLDGRAGYHLLTPLRTENGHWVLVNRGWLARGRDRASLPAIPPIEGPVTVRGRAYVPSDRTFVLREDDLDAMDWPLRVQRLDMEALSRRLEVELAPFEIRVAPDFRLEGGAGLPRVWHDARLGPERHRAYALQWFTMAAAAVVLFILAGLRRRQTRR